MTEEHNIEVVMSEVVDELYRGDHKHGRQDGLCLEKFYLIVGEEFGELGQAVSAMVFDNGKHHDELCWKEEAVQCMAMLLKMLLRGQSNAT